MPDFSTTCWQARNLDLLDQLADLLRRLPTAAYRQPLAVLHGHSAGQHTRHVVEFYECLLGGLDDGGVINYDARLRSPCLETDPAVALATLEELAQRLQTLPADRPLYLETAETAPVPTSLARELCYLVEHTVHHLAILKIALNVALPHFFIPETFGVAHSTLRHRNQLAVGS